MTPRKELYASVLKKLKCISLLELVDLQRGQMEDPNQWFGSHYTAALVEIENINYESRTNKQIEGNATVSIYLYVKDGFMHQQSGSSDAGNGLNEIDLIDEITESLQFLQGTQFVKFELSNEAAEESPAFGIMAYRLDFETWINKQTSQKYVNILN